MTEHAIKQRHCNGRLIVHGRGDQPFPMWCPPHALEYDSCNPHAGHNALLIVDNGSCNTTYLNDAKLA